MTNAANTRPAGLSIRPARAGDSAAVFAMVRTIWGGRDYVPEVWDEWLADGSGPLLVGTVADLPVALAKISALARGEDWFHGLRVDPSRRGNGYARAMLARCAAIARERGARTLRYLTDEQNKPMHHLAAEHGFKLIYSPAWYSAPARPGAARAEALAPAQLDRLLAQLERSPLLALTGGLYSYGWRNLELTPERMRQHLARGEVRALRGDDAWAIVTPRDGRGLMLAHIEGPPAAIERLCYDLRATDNPADTAEEYLQALLPPAAPGLGALRAAGFGAAEDPMRVYELRFAR